MSDTRQWKMVPVEPTIEMMQAGYRAIMKADKTQAYGEAIANAGYDAMLAASPAPQSGEPVAWLLRKVIPPKVFINETKAREWAQDMRILNPSIEPLFAAPPPSAVVAWFRLPTTNPDGPGWRFGIGSKSCGELADAIEAGDYRPAKEKPDET